MFGLVAAGSGVGAVVAWLNGPIRAALPITLYFVFFLGSAGSFYYTTRRGKFIEWPEFWTASACAATSRSSTWGAVAALC